MRLVRVLSAIPILALVSASAACSSTPPSPTQTPVVLVVTATPAAAATSVPAANATSAPAAPGKTDSISGSVSAGATPGATAAGTSGPLGTTGSGITGASNGQVEVPSLAVLSEYGKIVGGSVSKVKVTAERTPNKDLMVGFFEDEVGGTGSSWRAAGWQSVIMTSLLLGVDPTEYRFTYQVKGFMDGPSAGGMMTVATLAAILGHTIKPDIVMTGTINPDGSIGAVGGIPQKIDGAAAGKMKTVLIPAGLRNSVDLVSKKPVDVVARGKEKNVEVKEVADIYEAYQLITGKELPKPAGMKEMRAELPSVAYEKTKAKTKEWYSKYSQIAGQFEALPKALHFEFAENLLDEAAKSANKASSYYDQGMIAPAYSKAVDATVSATIAYQSAKVIEAYQNGGVKGGYNYLKSLQTVQIKLQAIIDRLKSQSPNSLGEVLAVSEAFGNISLAMGLNDMAETAINRDVKTEEEAVGALTEATLWYALADHMIEASKDVLDVGSNPSKAALPAQAKIESLSELFRRAAQANMNYFDQVVLNNIASNAGVHLDVMRAGFASQDITYSFANSSYSSMEKLKSQAGSGTYGAYAMLGGAINSFTMSSALIAKHDSIGIIQDDNNNITGVQNERAMINMLDLGEKRAREYIGLASSADMDPVQAILNYEGAKASREGTFDDKFSALQSFWSASIEGQIIGMLSGKSRVIK